MGTNISKGKTNNSTSFSFANLPDLIVANIISLLPIQSIVQCRAVCKAWLRSISGIDFNSIYQKRGKKDSYMTFIACSATKYNIFEFNMKDGTLGSVEPTKPVELTFRFGFSILAFEFVGCCNGLLCIADTSPLHAAFYIWNPVLAEYILIPEPRDTTNWIRKPLYEYYAFGYCPLTKEYKVLKAEKDSDNLEVLTIGPNTTSWRSLGKSCCRPRECPEFRYLNGVIHWICSCIDESNSDWINCFDCGTEQQHSLRPPRDCFHIHGFELVRLTVLRNRLCLVHLFDDDIVVWVMENYGVAESWIKESYHSQFDHSFFKNRPVPLLREDKNILFFGCNETFCSLCYYGYDRRQCVNIETTLKSLWAFHVFNYIPSFVPLLEVFKKNPSKMPLQQSRYIGWLGYLHYYLPSLVLLLEVFKKNPSKMLLQQSRYIGWLGYLLGRTQ